MPNLNQSNGGESVCSGCSSGFRPSNSYAKWLIAGILAFAAAWSIVLLLV